MPKRTANEAKKVKNNFFNNKQFWSYVALTITVATIFSLAIFNLSSYPKAPRSVVLGESIELKNEADYWMGFLENNPSYTTGWLELAKIQIKLGQTENAKRSLENAKKIDPNLEEIYNIEYQL